MTDVPNTPSPPGGTLRCAQCSYDLTGLNPSALCPECALPVAQSIHGFPLCDTPSDYQRRLLSGLRLIVLGIPASIGVAIAAMLVSELVLDASLLTRISLDTVMWLSLANDSLIILPFFAVMLGHWRYATPEPGIGDAPRSIPSRRVVRIASVTLLVAVAGQTSLSILSQALARDEMWVVRVFVGSFAATTSTIAVAVFALLMATARYTAWIARRIPDPRSARRARLYRWPLPFLAVTPLITGMASMLLIIKISTPTGPNQAVMSAIDILGAIATFSTIPALIALILYWHMLFIVRRRIRALISAQISSQP